MAIIITIIVIEFKDSAQKCITASNSQMKHTKLIKMKNDTRGCATYGRVMRRITPEQIPTFCKVSRTMKTKWDA